MIPQIRRAPFRRHEKFAFGAGEDARPLRILLDRESIIDGEALDILLGFAHHPHVDAYSTREEGISTLTVGHYNAIERYAPVTIAHSDGGQTIAAALVWDLYADREWLSGEDIEEARRLLLMAAASEDLVMDALVTNSDFLLEKAPRSVVDTANPMSPEQAVALLGLCLRARDDFSYEYGTGWSERFDRGFFYLILARELLPEAWRWFAACVYHSAATRDDQLTLLAQSAVLRLDRALRARDRMHRELQLPPDGNCFDEALFYFDTALLMLGASFDVVARVAHIVYELPGNPRIAGWRTTRWREALAARDEELAALMEEGQPARDALDLVANLRNTIHSAMLHSVTRVVDGQKDLVAPLPRPLADEIQPLVERHGDLREWGVEEEGDGLILHPSHYLDAALPHAADALNQLMARTNVERLVPRGAPALPLGPPEDEGPQNVYGADIRHRLRLLAGLA